MEASHAVSVGICIGASNVKVAVLEWEGDSFRVLSTSSIRHDCDPTPAILEQLRLLSCDFICLTGRRLKEDDSKCILLGEKLAATLEKKVGDKIQVYDEATFTVVGTFKSPVVYELQSMVVLLSDLQRIKGRKGQVSGFAVIVEHPENKAEVDRIIKAITALGPKIDAKPPLM